MAVDPELLCQHQGGGGEAPGGGDWCSLAPNKMEVNKSREAFPGKLLTWTGHRLAPVLRGLGTEGQGAA